MSEQLFDRWLDKLKEVWELQRPDEIIGLCADKFIWYDNPFDEPFTTSAQLLAEWRGILNQENINVTKRILLIHETLCVAQWHATFNRLPSKERVELDGIFYIRLNDQMKCTEFRQWYNAKS